MLFVSLLDEYVTSCSDLNSINNYFCYKQRVTTFQFDVF